MDATEIQIKMEQEEIHWQTIEMSQSHQLVQQNTEQHRKSSETNFENFDFTSFQLDGEKKNILDSKANKMRDNVQFIETVPAVRLNTLEEPPSSKRSFTLASKTHTQTSKSKKESSKCLSETSESISEDSLQLTEQSEAFDQIYRINYPEPEGTTLDPCGGISFIDQVIAYDQLKDTYIPCDFTELIQTMQHPSDPSLFITVQDVTQNVSHCSRQINRPPGNLPCPQCQTTLHLTKNAEDEQVIFCQLCDKDCFRFHYRCRNRKVSKASQTIWSRRKSTIELSQLSKSQSVLETGLSCQSAVCARCYVDYFVRRQQEKKNSLHYFWTGDEFAGDDIPKKERMAVLGVWQHSLDGLSCVAQYFLEDPIYFQMSVKTRSRTNIERKLLHTTEKGEIFAFSGSEKSITLSFVNLADQQDLKRFRKLPFHNQFKLADFEDLEKSWLKEVFMKEGTQETTYVSLPRIVENLLIFPSKESESSSYLICYDYRLKSSKLLSGGRLFLGSKYQNKKEDEPPEYVFVLGHTMHIFCLRWSTMTNVDYSDMYEVTQIFNIDDDIKAVYKLKTTTADDKIEELINADISAAVYDQGSYCTIFSQAKRKWLTYDLNMVFNDDEPLIEPVQHQILSQQQKSISTFTGGDTLYTFQSVFKTSLPSELGAVSYEIHVIQKQDRQIGKILIQIPKEFANAIPAERLVLNVLKYEPLAGKFACTLLLKRPSSKETVMFYVQNTVPERLSNNEPLLTKTFISQPIERQIVYPYHCRTTYHPANNRIMITNMQVNCPSRVICLKEGFKFVKFAQIPQNSILSEPLKLKITALVQRNSDFQLRLMTFTLDTLHNPEIMKLMVEKNKILDIDVAGKMNYQREIKFAFCQNFKTSLQDPCLTQIVIQASQQVEVYNDGNLVQLETHLKVSPVPMICTVNSIYLYVSGTDTGDQVVALYVDQKDPNVTLQKVVHMQPSRILQLQAIQEDQKQNISKFRLIDEEGDTLHLQIHRNEKIITAHSNKLDKSKNTFKDLNLKDVVLKRLTKDEWSHLVFDEAFVFSVSDECCLQINAETGDRREVDCLRFAQKFNQKQSKYRQATLEMQKIDGIQKLFFVMQAEKQVFVLIKHNPKKKIMDFFTPQLMKLCVGSHFNENEIVLEFLIGGTSTWAHFNPNTHMLEKLLVFKEQTKIVTSNDPGKQKFVIVNDSQLNTQTLLFYPESADPTTHETILVHFQDVMEKEQALMESIFVNSFTEINRIYSPMDQPIILSTGQMSIIWIAEQPHTIQPPEDQLDEGEEEVEYVRIKAVYTSQIRKIDMKQKLNSGSRFNHTFKQRSNTFMGKETFERKIAGEDQKYKPGTNISYIIVDPLERRSRSNFATQVVLTEKYLVWTSPDHINFIEIEQIFVQQVKQPPPTLTERIKMSLSRTRNKFSSPERSTAKGDQSPDNTTRNLVGSSIQQMMKALQYQKEYAQIVEDLVGSRGIPRKRIPLRMMFSSQSLKEIQISVVSPIDRKFVVRDSLDSTKINDGENEAERKNLIQIKTGDVSLIWDLEQYEEVTFLAGWSHFVSTENSFARTGHDLSRADCPLLQNLDASVFLMNQMKEQGECEVKCFRLYSDLDLQLLKFTQEMTRRHLNVKDGQIYYQSLTSNIMGRSFITLFYSSHQIMGHIKNYVLGLDNQPVIEDHIEVSQEFDPIQLRKLNQILLLPAIIGNELIGQSLIARVLNLGVCELFEFDEVISEQIVKQSSGVRQAKLYDLLLKNKTKFLEIYKLDQQLAPQLEDRRASQAQKVEVPEPYESVQTIYSYALFNDQLLFNYLCQILSRLREIRLNHIVNTFEDFDKVFSNLSLSCSNFLNKSNIRTGFTKRIKVLRVPDANETIFFQAETPLLTDQQIEQQFEKVIQKKSKSSGYLLNKFKTHKLHPFEISVMEIEWLEGNIQKFFQKIARSDDELIYENKLIQFFLQKVSYQKDIIKWVFCPFLIYSAACIYNHTFILPVTVSTDNFAYFGGPKQDVVARIIIAILTLNFVRIEIIQIMSNLRQYVFEDWAQNLEFWCFLTLNFFLTVYHPKNQEGHLPLRIAQISSVMTILIWIHLYFWLRIFSSTAIYVQIITQTISDVKVFLLVFFICLAMFGNGKLVLSNFVYQITEGQGSNLIPVSTGVNVVDSVINEYVQSLGTFNLDVYNTYPGGFVLVWIYFLGTTFITNIMIFNMLIAIMQQAYERVRLNETRNKLMMITKIQTQNIFLLGKQQPFGSSRYLYLAEPVQSQDTEQFQLAESIQSMQTQIQDGIKNENTNTTKVIRMVHTELAEAQFKINEHIDENRKLIEVDRQDLLVQSVNQEVKIDRLEGKLDALEEKMNQLANYMQQISAGIAKLEPH